MNRFYFVSVLLCAVFFFIGFKIGDKGGFEAGFGEGYTYDCQEEIKSLKATHEELKRVLEFQKKFTVDVQRVNDSIKYHSVYGVRDSLRAVKFKEDSLKNWKKVKAFNDSVNSLKDGKFHARKRADGSKVPAEELLEYMENK